MGDFELRDQIRDQDRRLARAERELSRLPITLPTLEIAKTLSVLLIRCEDSLPVVVQNVELSGGRGRLSAYIGKVVRLEADALLEEACWHVDSTIDCSSGICPEICDIMDDCSNCGDCYTLTPCDDGSEKKVKRGGLCGSGFGIQPGDVVRLDDNLCYTVSEASYCETPEEVTVVAVFDNCDDCGSCYFLTRCGTSETKAVYRDESWSEALEVGDVIKINGTCWEVTSIGNCSGDPEAITISPGNKFDSCYACGCYKLTLCPDQTDAIAAFPDPIYVDFDEGGSDLEDAVGKVIRSDDGFCYQVERSQDCDTTEAVTIQEVFERCGDQTGEVTDSCRAFELDPCEDEDEEGNAIQNISTYSDMYGQGIQDGDVFRRAEDQKCYTLIGVTPWSETSVAATVETKYENCLDCTDPTYRLDECPGCAGDPPGALLWTVAITTNEDLLEVIGKVIKYKKICYLVSQEPNNPSPDHESIEWTGPFDNCEACLPTEIQVVNDVYVEGDELKQDIMTVIVNQVCDEDTETILSFGDCDA